MKKLFYEYWGELLVGGLVIIGILLKIAHVDIHTILVGALYQLFIGTRETTAWTSLIMQSFLTSISVYDLISFVLLLMVMIFLSYRLRGRYLKGLLWKGDACPKCKGNIHRIHRSPHDRLWSSLMRRSFRRYQCSNPDCGWSGLLYGKPHEHHHEPSDTRVLQKSLK